MEDKIKLQKMWTNIPILVWKDDLSLIETRGQLFWLRSVATTYSARVHYI